MEHLIVTGFDQITCFFEIWKVVLRKVLQLYVASSEAAGPGSAVELEKSATSAVIADGILHGLILFDAGFCYLLPEPEDICYIPRHLFNEGFYFFLPQAFDS